MIFLRLEEIRFDQLCNELNMLVPIKNLGDLTWYGGCHYSRDKDSGLLAISQQAFTKRLVEKYGRGSSTCIPASPAVKLDEVDPEKPEGDWPFRKVVGSLVSVPNQTRPDIVNVERAVAR